MRLWKGAEHARLIVQVRAYSQPGLSWRLTKDARRHISSDEALKVEPDVELVAGANRTASVILDASAIDRGRGDGVVTGTPSSVRSNSSVCHTFDQLRERQAIDRGHAMQRRGISIASIFILLLCGARATASFAAGENTSVGPDVPDSAMNLPASAAKTKSGLTHLDSGLNELLALWLTDEVLARNLAAARNLSMIDDRVHVTIRMRDLDSATAAMSAISAIGGTVSARFKATIDAWVPISALGTLNRLEGVSIIHQPIPPMPLPVEPPGERPAATNAGSYLTAGFYASNADDWYSSGFRGSGINVALVDSFLDAATAIYYGELPDPTYCYPTCESLDVSSRHGTACAEIIHDLAPEASITLSSAGTATEMAQMIVDLAASGHDVISASMAFLDINPGDGTGIMADAIWTARDSYGTLYVGSAGNNADFHWDGNFTDADVDGYNEFFEAWEVNLLNSAYGTSAGTKIMAYLRWSSWPVTDQDFDLELYFFNGSAWEFIAEAAAAQTGTQPPFEFLYADAPYSGIYALAVKKYSATTSPVLDLMAWGRHQLDIKDADRSLLEPATAPYSFSVAAVDAGSYMLESYSSWGPTYGAGGSLAGGYAQPRISGYANVDTWSYGPGVFNGTSAAAPHVAGAAALVRSAFPSYTPDQTQAFLESRAVDSGAPGYDYLYGYGRLWLGTPTCSYSISPTSTSVNSGGGAGSVSVITTAGCQWTAASNDAWILVTSGSPGEGSGSVAYSVAANPDPAQRTGTMTIAGHTFTVNQDGDSSSIFGDGFESGNTSAWSAAVP